MKNFIVATLFLTILSGCIDRKERIHIHTNGSMDVLWQVKGDEADMQNGSQYPSTSPPWNIEKKREVKPRKDGGEDISLSVQAEATFSTMSEYHQSLQFSPLDLQIQTSLEIKTEGKRTFYHFKRHYGARDFWKFERLREVEIDQKLTDRVSEKGLTNLKPSEQKKFLQQLVQFEQKKRLLLIEDALGILVQKTRFPLSERQAILEKFRTRYALILNAERLEQWLKLTSALDAEKQKEKSAEKATLQAEFDQQVLQIENELKQAEQEIFQGYSSSYPQINFQKYVDTVREEYHLTEDLNDENFEVELTLPGTLLYTNGERKADGKEMRCFWKFEGKHLSGRHLPLEAISVVESNE